MSKNTPRYIFFLHWSWKVPKSIWQNHECVCFHMTDVPYGRGGSPLQNLILQGRQETQLTALRMVEEMDAGPIYAKTVLSLRGRAEEIYIEAGRKSLEIALMMIAVEPKPIPQQGEVFVFKRRKPEDSELPKSGNLEKIYDYIRMLDAPGYPLAFLEYGNYKFEFSHAVKEDAVIRATVLIHLK